VRDGYARSTACSTRSPQVAVLVYLTATDERSGALRVVPGSQTVPRGGWHERLLPRFDGERVDLPLSLAAPH
jgi:ectoine hydroxylase-related dioxygenase (phytanoyl-CoA dioxygenase family)